MSTSTGGGKVGVYKKIHVGTLHIAVLNIIAIFTLKYMKVYEHLGTESIKIVYFDD